MNKPKILLADEPTAALDGRLGRQVMDLFRKVAHEQLAGIIVVTHEADIAGYAHRVVAIRDGQVEKDVRQEPHAAVAHVAAKLGGQVL